jgi:acetyltransferase-like isoleucine patch superfamily enzyme
MVERDSPGQGGSSPKKGSCQVNSAHMQNDIGPNQLALYRWREKCGLLDEKQRGDLLRAKLRLYPVLFLKGLVKAAILLSKSPWRIYQLLSEMEELHYRPRQRMKKGRGCVIDKQTWLINGRNIFLGDHVKISAYTAIMAGHHSQVHIGSDTMIGPGVLVTSFNHGFYQRDMPMKYQPYIEDAETSVRIGEDVWIGAHAIILPGSVIGSHSIIAAGALVKGEIPANSIFRRKSEPVLSTRPEVRGS